MSESDKNLNEPFTPSEDEWVPKSNLTVHDSEDVESEKEENKQKKENLTLVKGESVKVCQNMFLAMHAIKRDRLRKKILNFGKVNDVRDYREKHSNRPNRIKDEYITQVYNFLDNLPTNEFHYSRSQNRKVFHKRSKRGNYGTGLLAKKKYKTPEPTELTIFCDNCFLQNKNRFLFTYLDLLCAALIVKEIEITYPVPGHSMIPVDRCFALIGKNRLKHEKVNTPEYYVNLIASARIKKLFDIVFLEHTLFTSGKVIAKEIPALRGRDFKKMYGTKIKSCIPGISKCRSAIFPATSKPKIRESMGGLHNEFSLYKIGNQRLTAGLIPDLA
ncbi:hypothetical protein ILUMI_18524 [Ignelater luminosus]|uniref:DUF7869 domain-containing protein n=1 Tax=Ignelater luminosus TaxID=2038154 RepID=A0A8K0CHU9_IGNLU|nr:hypothetical protein ILUMI_18524 [Ignelater luminosus]